MSHSAGAGAFEVAAAHHLRTVTKKSVEGRAKLGVEAFAEALLGTVKTLAENSGLDAQDALIALQVRGLSGFAIWVYVKWRRCWDYVKWMRCCASSRSSRRMHI